MSKHDKFGIDLLKQYELCTLRDMYEALPWQAVIGTICCIAWLTRIAGRWSHKYRFSKQNIDQLFMNKKSKILKFKRYAILQRNILGKFLQGHLRGSAVVSKIIDKTDSILTMLLWPFVQNWLIIARKS